MIVISSTIYTRAFTDAGRLKAAKAIECLSGI